MTDSKTHRRYYLQLVLALLGAGISLYLLVQHTRLKTGIQGGSLCNLGEFANCNVVQTSSYSQLFGIPLATFGLLYFLSLFVLGALLPPRNKAFVKGQIWLARFAAIAVLVDAYLFGVQLFALKSFCLFCISTYLCTFGHLALNWFLRAPGERNWKSFLVGGKRNRLPSFAWAMTAAVVAVSGLFAYNYSNGSQEAHRRANVEKSKQTFVETWAERPSKPIPVKASDATRGKRDAKVQVVVFSDFECPHCQRAAFALETALAPERDQVLLVFKNFPLDMACNNLLKQPIHQNACALAYLGYCANKKNRFWDFHDRVYYKLSGRDISSSQDRIQEGLKTIFTKKEFDECLKNPDAQAAIREDIELGKQVGVDSTPSIYINGKRVSFTPTVDFLRDLVQKELKK